MRQGKFLVEITSVVDRKVQAMNCLKSQFYPGNLVRYVEITNGRMDLHTSIPYTEAYQRLDPDGYNHLLVNQLLMERPRTPWSQLAEQIRVQLNDVPVLR